MASSSSSVFRKRDRDDQRILIIPESLSTKILRRVLVERERAAVPALV